MATTFPALHGFMGDLEYKANVLYRIEAVEEAPPAAPAPAALPPAGSGGLLGEEGSSLPT